MMICSHYIYEDIISAPFLFIFIIENTCMHDASHTSLLRMHANLYFLISKSLFNHDKVAIQALVKFIHAFNLLLKKKVPKLVTSSIVLVEDKSIETICRLHKDASHKL